MQRFLRGWAPWLGIMALSLAIGWPLFAGKIIFLADGAYAFVKAVAMAESWRHADFAGRWTPDVIYGNGYPMFNYYSPLFFYVFALGALAGVPVFWAFNLCIYLALAGSGAAMYLLGRQLWGARGGFLSAVAYMVAPYHILDLYSRGALAEFTAFVFFPMVILAIHRVVQGPRLKDGVLGILSVAGLILSHNISALFFCTVSFLYLIFQWAASSGRRKTFSLAAGLGLLIAGALLTAYFWLPALAEKKYVQIERLLTGIYDYHRNFISLRDLLKPSWPGTGGQLSFMIGPWHLVLASAAVLGCRRMAAEKRPEVFFWLAVAVVSCFLTLPASGPVWRHLTLLQFAEFPWRMLMCTAFAVSVLAGGCAAVFPEKLRAAAMILAGVVLAASGVRMWHAFGYQDIHYASAKDYLYHALPMDNMEYLPKAVSRITLGPWPQKLQSLSGPMTIVPSEKKYLDERYTVNSPQGGLLVFHTYNFPGWKVEVDRKAAAVLNNPWGLIMFAVPSGEAHVRIHFTDTPIRQLAAAISALAGLALLLGTVFYKRLMLE